MVDIGNGRAELEATVDDVGGEQVHGGAADEAGANTLFGFSYR